MAELKTKLSPYKPGIDLGNCYHNAAIFHGGKGEIPELKGQRIMPSVVSIDDKGNILVGYQAKKQILLNPDKKVKKLILRRLKEWRN